MLPRYALIASLCFFPWLKAYSLGSDIDTVVSMAPDFVGTVIMATLWSIDAKRRAAEVRSVLDSNKELAKLVAEGRNRGGQDA